MKLDIAAKPNFSRMLNSEEDTTKSSLGVSVVLHILIVLLISLNMTAFNSLPDIPEPIVVDFVESAEVAEKTQAPRETVEPPTSKPISDAKPKPAEVEQKPEPAKASAPEPVAEPEPEKLDAVEEDAPELPAKEAIAPAPTKRPEPPKVEKKPEETKEPEKTEAEDVKPEENKDRFNSLLKNLAAGQEASQAEDADPDSRQAPMLTQPPPVGETMTVSELSLLRRQLASCWNLLPGAKNADDIVVEVAVTMNADRTVQQARVLNTARVQSDPVYRAAADSALRALRHPNCSPLELPTYKYQQWKTMTLRFDPKEMF